MFTRRERDWRRGRKRRGERMTENEIRIKLIKRLEELRNKRKKNGKQSETLERLGGNHKKKRKKTHIKRY